MTPPTVGVDEVYEHLLDRILTGAHPVGSRLPSCRALARELGSNSSTVDRAIGRLAADGRVRTIPRRGTFVESIAGEEVDARTIIAGRMEDLLLRARRLGIPADELTAMVGSVLDRVDSMRRIAVVECNQRDLRTLQELVQDAIDIEVQPVLLHEAAGRRLDREFDAVAVPIFHLRDVADLVDDLDQVVELNLVASPTALRQLIDVRDEERLVVVAPSARGIQWMTALVGQYFPGRIDTVLAGDGVEDGEDGLAALKDAPVVVVNNAAQVPAEVLAGIDRLIAIEWELDRRFVTTLRTRIENVMAARNAQPPARTTGRGAA